ncbi:hypothetical protein BH20ACI2_BH20ACI2_10070 [soil metagenome]
MSRSVVEKAVCEECGVDVRESTLFCYNCGNPLEDPELSGQLDDGRVSSIDTNAASEPVGKDATRSEARINKGIKPEAKAALEDLAERIKIEPPATDDEGIALAAASRKKARGAKKKAREYVWEPVEDPPGRLMLMIVAMITLLAALAVVATVVWK